MEEGAIAAGQDERKCLEKEGPELELPKMEKGKEVQCESAPGTKIEMKIKMEQFKEERAN